MCHKLWNNQIRFPFGQTGSHAVIHSYQVPLIRELNVLTSDGTEIKKRYIDLLASSSDGLPILIEAKYQKEKENIGGASKAATSGLFAQFMQGLSYAVTLRYTWSKSLSFHTDWAKSLPTDPPPSPKLGKLPIILAANPHYWKKNFSWGTDKQHWMDLCTLVTVAQNSGYPIYLGVIQEPVVHDPQWQFRVIPWDSIPTPTTNGPIQFPANPTS
jgi:hypothetical protein